METYDSPYTGRFSAAYLVHTAREIFAWTEHHEYTANAEWPVDVYQNTGDPYEDAFILAVPTPSGFVAFFAGSGEEADKIRESVF